MWRAEEQEFELAARVLLVLLKLFLDLLVDAARLARLLRQAAVERLEHRAVRRATSGEQRDALPSNGATGYGRTHWQSAMDAIVRVNRCKRIGNGHVLNVGLIWMLNKKVNGFDVSSTSNGHENL